MSNTGAFSGGLVQDGFLPLKVRKIPITVEDGPVERIEVQADISVKSKVKVGQKLGFAAIIKHWAVGTGFVLAIAASLLVAKTFDQTLLYGEEASPRIAPASIVLPPFSESVKSNGLTADIKQIESQTISFNLGGKVVNPAPSDIAKWLSVDKSQGTNIVTVNQFALTSYIDGLISQYSTEPTNQVTVTHPDGSAATLQSGSAGVQYSGTDNIVYAVAGKLLSGGGNSVTVPSITIPYKVSNSSEYSALLEVDVTTKRMYAYQNGDLIRTFLVTAGAPETPTPLGTFKIWSKFLEQNMTGYNVDGTKYLQPDVQYINYFDHNGDAIHANYWRPLSYFGNVNSSHGCVGVTTSDAEWIYNWAPIGTTIVIHA